MQQQKDAGLLSRGTAGTGNANVTGGLKSNPPDNAPITLAEAGIDKNLADRARKYASVPEDEFENILADRRERIETENKRVTVNLLEAGVRGTLGTADNEWHTPAEHVELVRQVLGEIDLDPASSSVAQRAVKAGHYYSIEDDGREQPWAGRVYLNPPYAQPLISDFISESKLGPSACVSLLGSFLWRCGGFDMIAISSLPRSIRRATRWVTP